VQTPRQRVGHQRKPGQLLPHAVVQLLADALLLAGGDFDDVAPEGFAGGDVAMHRDVSQRMRPSRHPSIRNFLTTGDYSAQLSTLDGVA
jgi:hypothetical protein